MTSKNPTENNPIFKIQDIKKYNHDFLMEISKMMSQQLDKPMYPIYEAIQLIPVEHISVNVTLDKKEEKEMNLIQQLEGRYSDYDEGKTVKWHKDENYLELQPRGFTKPDEHGVNRQELHKKLYLLKEHENEAKLLYPFGKNGYKVKLVPDPTNKYDSNAIEIKLILNAIDSTELSLGWIPAEVSAYFKKELNLVKNIYIYSVEKGAHGKYYSARVAINLRNPSRKNSRFANLILED